jgi:hypothetical protein
MITENEKSVIISLEQDGGRRESKMKHYGMDARACRKSDPVPKPKRRNPLHIIFFALSLPCRDIRIPFLAAGSAEGDLVASIIG